MWAFIGTPARGDTTVRGQLTITNITTADNGSYTNTLTNTLNDGSNRSMSTTVQLQVLSEFACNILTVHLSYNYSPT